jgi:hypothetical protein
MRIVIAILFFVVVLIYPLAARAAYTGVISVDSVAVKAGQSVALPVRLSNNNVDISGVQIPLRIDPIAFVLDSVSFQNSIKPVNFSTQLFWDSYSESWIVSVLPPTGSSGTGYFSTAGGTLFEVHLTAQASTLPGAYAVDSANVDSVLVLPGGLEIHKWRRGEITDPTPAFHLPGFEPGKVQVLVPTSAGDEPSPELPETFSLSQNYPNPFNPSTVIEYALPQASRVRLDVFNVLGQKQVTLVNGDLPAGAYEAHFDASDLPSGVYFYRLEHALGSETRKMILVK